MCLICTNVVALKMTADHKFTNSRVAWLNMWSSQIKIYQVLWQSLWLDFTPMRKAETPRIICWTALWCHTSIQLGTIRRNVCCLSISYLFICLNEKHLNSYWRTNSKSKKCTHRSIYSQIQYSELHSLSLISVLTTKKEVWKSFIAGQLFGLWPNTQNKSIQYWSATREGYGILVWQSRDWNYTNAIYLHDHMVTFTHNVINSPMKTQHCWFSIYI